MSKLVMRTEPDPSFSNPVNSSNIVLMLPLGNDFNEEMKSDSFDVDVRYNQREIGSHDSTNRMVEASSNYDQFVPMININSIQFDLGVLLLLFFQRIKKEEKEFHRFISSFLIRSIDSTFPRCCVDYSTDRRNCIDRFAVRIDDHDNSLDKHNSFDHRY